MKESKLTYKLNQLSADDRDTLLGRLGISLGTYYQHKNNPGMFTLDELNTVREFLEEREGKDLDIYKLATELVEV
jgi:hypothetical protein